MLVNQGVIGFKIWTGIDPYPAVMREALEEVVTWDEWDPDRDRFSMDWRDYSEGVTRENPFANEGS